MQAPCIHQQHTILHRGARGLPTSRLVLVPATQVSSVTTVTWSQHWFFSLSLLTSGVYMVAVFVITIAEMAVARNAAAMLRSDAQGGWADDEDGVGTSSSWGSGVMRGFRLLWGASECCAVRADASTDACVW